MNPISEKHFAILRGHTVKVTGIHTDLNEEELEKEKIEERILTAMLPIPRHLFVPEPLAHLAYHDGLAADRVPEDDLPAVYVCPYD